MTRPYVWQLHQSGATDGQVVAWDNTLMRWVPADPAGGAGLDDLTDVDTTTTPPTGGQALVFDDASNLWVPGDGAAAPNGLPTGGADGQVLTKQSATDYDAAWETPSGGSSATAMPAHKAGRFYMTPISVNTGSGAAALGRCFFVPFLVPSTTTYDRVLCEVTVLAASSSVRLGLYDGSTGVPDALLFDWGTVVGTSVGVKSITISQSLSPGWYFLAGVSQGGTPTLRSIGAGTQLPMLGFTANTDTVPARGFYVDSVTGALPSPAGALTEVIASNGIPRVMLRAA